MASSDWTLTAYLVNLSQNCEMESKRVERENHIVQGEETGSERVFTELKPAFAVDPSCCDSQQKDARRLLQRLNAGTVYGKERPDCFSARREDRFELGKESVVEQPLISWDLNRLTVLGGEAVVGDVCDESGSNSIYESLEGDFSSGNTASQGLRGEISKNGNDENDEEFRFPKCIEDQFREMILRAHRQTDWHLDKCGSKTLHEEVNEPQNSLHHHGYYREGPVSNGIVNDSWLGNSLGGIAEEGLNHIKITDEASKERDNWATKTLNERAKRFGSEHNIGENQELVNDIKDESIEQLLNFINPEIDVMGKTFHNIPSTQPIYSDNEARDTGSGDEIRVRRPMNAFMLWARKYRSLVAKEFSEASNSEISVKLGEIWNELTSEQQRPYFKKAEWLKAKHKQSHPNYVYQPRQSYKTVRKMRNSSLCTGNDLIGGFSMFPLEFGTPYELLADIKQKAIMPAATQEQSKEQIQDYRSSCADIQHKIMAPKPVYPRNVSTRRIKCSENDLEEQISVTKQDPKVVVGQSQLVEGSCLKRDTGLVKDAMMPRPERNSDECDLVNSHYPSLNVENLDEFLAEENNELITYLENCMKRKDIEYKSICLPKKSEKTKRVVKNKVKGPRVRKLKRLARN